MNLLHWTQFLVVSEWAIRLVMLPIIVLRKERTATCLAWLAVIFFEPWLGLAVYLLVGENRLGRRRLARRRRRQPEFESSEYPDIEAQHRLDPRQGDEENEGPLADLARQLGDLPVVAGNSVSFLSDNDRAIDRLIVDIEAAQKHVHLLFYIIADDEVGRQVGEALIRARRRGVACRVLADAVGSRRMFRRLAPRLRQQGVEVLPVLPVNLWRLPFARIDLRNHRKLVVIDGQIAYTGSQNIVEATYGHKKAGRWHDILARMTGPVVRQLQFVFLEDWFHESDQLLDDDSLFPAAEAAGKVAIQVVPSGPDLPTEQFQDLIVRAIFTARKRVVITSPYFVPDEAMLLALRLAALRGVQVDLVVPQRSDHWLVDAAGSFYLEYLMRFGVSVYLHREGMLHSKTLTIDDRLAMFGSANYDIRSFELNFELNVLLQASVAVAELYCLQERYREQSDKATLGDWPTRTLAGRLKVNVAKLLSPLL
jgi:cardiolipin synthase